jgi:hypothetical protein
MLLETRGERKRREEMTREEVFGGFGLPKADWAVSTVPKTSTLWDSIRHQQVPIRKTMIMRKIECFL